MFVHIRHGRELFPRLGFALKWLNRGSDLRKAGMHIGGGRKLAVLALALGGFAIGTTEFVAMGLLPDIASSLNVTEPTAADDELGKWETQLRKGGLGLAALATLWPGRSYGLEILRRL